MNDQGVPVCIVHFDEDGNETFHVYGDGVRMLIIDERAPNDRVYEETDRIDAQQLAAFLRAGQISSKEDERHHAIEAGINALLDGKKHLTLVE